MFCPRSRNRCASAGLNAGVAARPKRSSAGIWTEHPIFLAAPAVPTCPVLMARRTSLQNSAKRVHALLLTGHGTRTPSHPGVPAWRWCVGSRWAWTNVLSGCRLEGDFGSISVPAFEPAMSSHHTTGNAVGGHAHGYHHGVSAGPDLNRRRLSWALVLAASYMAAEFVGGVMSGSLALIADAGHMLSDAASLALALFALWIGGRPPTAQFSYGYRRAEVLAALVNAVALLVVAGGICVEAYHRFADPPLVNGALMFGVATGGLVINLVMLRLLSAGRHDSLNIEGAWLHVLTDLLGSIGAIVSGLLIWRWGWSWVDPIASVVIVVLVVVSALSLMRRTAIVLMEATPSHIDIEAVQRCIAETSEVCSVHHLHVWTITGGMEALSAHVVVSDECNHDGLLERLRENLRLGFRIDHVTIQFEHQPCGDDHH